MPEHPERQAPSDMPARARLERLNHDLEFAGATSVPRSKSAARISTAKPTTTLLSSSWRRSRRPVPPRHERFAPHCGLAIDAKQNHAV